MARARSRIGLAIALVVLVGVAIAPATAVAQETVNETANSSAEPTANASEQESGLTLEDLQRGGSQVSGAAPSTRWLEGSGAVFIDYPSTDPLAPPAKDWEVENVLERGGTVSADQLRVNAQRPRDAGFAEYELVVVHWDKDWKQVGNETQEVATNVEQNEHTLSFDGPRDRATIDLPNTDGDRRQVTMWLERDGERVDGARWTFEHKSAPLTTDSGIDSSGDQLKWALLIFVVPLGIGIPVAVKGAQRVLAQTGKGPMIPAVIYGALGIGGMFMATVFGWKTTVTALVNQPLLFSLGLILLTFWAVLEWGGHDTTRAMFQRDELRDATTPTGEDVHDTLFQDMLDRRLVRTENEGEYIMVEPGPRAFLARWFGVAPTLDVSELSTQINVKQGKWDKLFVADPDAERALVYEKPTLTLSLSRETERTGWLGKIAGVRWSVFAWSLSAGGFAWLIGKALLGTPTAALVLGLLAGFLVSAATVVEGSIEFNAAPVHYTQARQVLADSQTEHADAVTIESLEEIAWSERSKSALDARRVQSHMDRTVTERMVEDELGLSGMFTDGDGDRDGDRDESEVDESAENDGRQATADEETSLVPADDD